MFGFCKKKGKKTALYATQTATQVKLEGIPDEVFATGILGVGTAVMPAEGIVKSPVSGTVKSITDTLHAICLTDENGVDFLVHVGIDTVQLNGEGFSVLVAEGDHVNVGDPLMDVNLDILKSKGYQLHTPTVITDADDITLDISEPQDVVSGETIVAYYSFSR